MLARVIGNLALSLAGVAIALVLAELSIPHLVPLRNVGASFTEYDPVMWKRLKREFTTVRTTSEFTMRFTTNSLGARGVEPRRPLRDAIVFLGDSFTMGYGVSDGKEYPALVQAEMARQFGANSPQVVNLGMGASGNGFWLKHLAVTIPAMKPRIVVMQVLENDFFDNQQEGLYSLDSRGELVELPVPAPSFARRVQGWVDKVPWLAESNLVGLVRQAASGSQRPDGEAPSVAPLHGTISEAQSAEIDLTVRIVAAAIERCRANGWSVILVAPGLSGAHSAAIGELAKAYNVPIVALPSKEERPDLYYVIDGHWNEKGHADAAERLLPALLSSDSLAGVGAGQ